LQIPAGKHNIEFKFEPQNKNRGMITLISSILIVLVLVVEFILKGRDLRLLISDFFYIIVLLKFLHLEQKKILIITYYCTRWTGVQRWLKFVKYLQNLAFSRSFIFQNPTYPIVDQNLVQDVSDQAIIFKTKIFEPYQLASFLSKNKTKR
jgi:hypothetical protein